MFVHSHSPVIAAVWLLICGLLALLWSPLSVAMGVTLLLVGLAGPAVLLIEWSDRSPTVPRALSKRPHAFRISPAPGWPSPLTHERRVRL